MSTSATTVRRHRKNSRYKWPVAYYVTLYGLPEGTIQNFSKRRWPLDNPKKLLQLMTNAPGPKRKNWGHLPRIVDGTLGQAETRELTSQEEQEADLKKKDPPPPADETPPEEESAQLSMALAGGLMEELSRLKIETAKSHRLYLAETKPSDKITRQRVWLLNVAALRQLAKEAPKAERDAKNVLVVSDVEATWSRAFSEFRNSAESLGRRVSTLALFAGLDPIDVEQAIAKETTTMLEHLESASHLKETDA